MSTPPAVLAAIRDVGRSEYARARQAIDEAKVGKPCTDCDRSGLPSEEMHFHHLNPSTKLYPVPRATTAAAARREIAKCVLLCADCHRARHRSVSREKSRDGRFEDNSAQLSDTEAPANG